jgi:hypothetical protein
MGSLAAALVLIVLGYFMFGISWVLILATILFVLLSYLFVIYAMSLDVCMIKLVSPGKLTEGDWLVSDVKIAAGKVVRKTVHGLSAEDIVMLKKAGKKVLIKDGIPFTPAFLTAFLIMVFFLAVLGFQIWAPLYSLF